jgi:Uma2 family endonuclease
MAVEPHDRRFTVDEYYRMAEAGIIGRDERVELIDGRIVTMSPAGSPHAWCVKRVNRIFSRLGDRVTLSIQDPLHLDDGAEPEPDVAVLRSEAPVDRHPGPGDVLLIVEVADTSLTYDRGTKAPLYARHGIPELWIADLGGERVEVHREPSPDGYRVVRVFGRGQHVNPLFASHLEIGVDDILGPPTSVG